MMHRAHNAMQARKCLEDALTLGFKNLSIDLMYGFPNVALEAWRSNIQLAMDYGIPHLSCYAMTVEPRTALAYQIRMGKVVMPPDQKVVDQFYHLIKMTKENNYDHYEISNFALPGYRAVHNTNYWLGTSYLGIGPSAHSFNGRSRSWNVANNQKYLKSLEAGIACQETEILAPEQIYNEYIMVRLRTKWGCNESDIKEIGARYLHHFLSGMRVFLDDNLVVKNDENYRLSEKGKAYADRVASDLFMID